jgi:hypothetical protein
LVGEISLIESLAECNAVFGWNHVPVAAGLHGESASRVLASVAGTLLVGTAIIVVIASATIAATLMRWINELRVSVVTASQIQGKENDDSMGEERGQNILHDGFRFRHRFSLSMSINSKFAE